MGFECIDILPPQCPSSLGQRRQLNEALVAQEWVVAAQEYTMSHLQARAVPENERKSSTNCPRLIYHYCLEHTKWAMYKAGSVESHTPVVLSKKKYKNYKKNGGVFLHVDQKTFYYGRGKKV
jgi:hypothetical protein